MEQNKKNFKLYLLLHGLLLLFSFAPVCSKLAGRYPVFSVNFFLFYGLMVLILGIYAIFWQQIIKRMPLTAAYANKAVTVVWGMVWGVLLFTEVVTVQKVVGAAVIIAGIVLYAVSGTNAQEKAPVQASAPGTEPKERKDAENGKQ